jgi:hypothetical protein
MEKRCGKKVIPKILDIKSIYQPAPPMIIVKGVSFWDPSMGSEHRADHNWMGRKRLIICRLIGCWSAAIVELDLDN